MDVYQIIGFSLLALWAVLFVGAFLYSAKEQRTSRLAAGRKAKKPDKPRRGGNADAA